MKNKQFLAACGISMGISMIGACASLDMSQPRAENNPAPPRMSSQDIALANQTFQNALEKSASGNHLTWRNPGTGHSGSITPQKTYRAQNGLYCRVFDETVVMTKNPQSFRNTACRDRDGVWKPI